MVLKSAFSVSTRCCIMLLGKRTGWLSAFICLLFFFSYPPIITHCSHWPTLPPSKSPSVPTVCCHCDPTPFHRTEMACSKAVPYRVQINSWNPIYGAAPLPSPHLQPCRLSHLVFLSPRTPLCLSPHFSLSLLQLDSYLFPLSVGMNPRSFFYLCPALSLAPSLCQTQYSFPLLTSNISPPPAPPAPTCSHRCVASIYGFITAAIQERGEKEKRDEVQDKRDRGETWEMRVRRPRKAQ